MTGKILRFDEVRGYGFIAPDEGHEDVFMHANDLVDEKYLYQAGRRVEFFVEGGEKGPKASEIRLITQPPAAPVTPAPRRQEDGDDDDDPTCDVLSPAEYRAELTELLLDADGTLTASQIQRVRLRLIEAAQAHGWVEAADS